MCTHAWTSKISFAGAELKIVQPDQPGLGAEFVSSFQRAIEDVFRARKSRIGRVHHRRRDAREAQWARGAFALSCKRMRRVFVCIRFVAGSDR